MRHRLTAVVVIVVTAKGLGLYALIHADISFHFEHLFYGGEPDDSVADVSPLTGRFGICGGWDSLCFRS
jgi:hypothetical protein